MRNTFSELAYDITQIIKGSGRVILMYDEDGNRTYDQKNAAKIFAYPDKMMIIITDDGIDSSVDIALSQNTDVLELQDFINTLRHLCTNYNVLFNIQKYGKEIEPKDFANYGNNTSSDLNECLEYYNKNREIINELFKGDSGVEIKEMLGTYYFNIDNINYEVYENNSEILFAIGNTGHSRFDPIKNNKNQFLVLNTVIKCVEQILKTKEIYYFSGSNKNGLGKLYSIMFKKLKNKAIEMGYVTLECGEHHFDEDSLFDTDYKPFKKINGEEYFWFIPKEMMTDYVYEEAKKLGIEVTGYN